MKDEPEKVLSPNEAAARFRRMMELWKARRDSTAKRDFWLKQLFPGGVGLYGKDRVVAKILQHFPSLRREEIVHMNPAEIGPYLEVVAGKCQDTTLNETNATGDSLSLEEKALATLVAHPEWSDKKIATHVGCNRTSLYRWDRYLAARAALESGRERMPKADQL